MTISFPLGTKKKKIRLTSVVVRIYTTSKIIFVLPLFISFELLVFVKRSVRLYTVRRVWGEGRTDTRHALIETPTVEIWIPFLLLVVTPNLYRTF